MMISDRTVGPVTFDSEYLQAQAGASLDSWALTDPDSGRDAFVAVTIHRTLVLLRNYALKEGNGVVTEYELDRLIIPIIRKLRALANGDNEGDDSAHRLTWHANKAAPTKIVLRSHTLIHHRAVTPDTAQ